MNRMRREKEQRKGETERKGEKEKMREKRWDCLQTWMDNELRAITFDRTSCFNRTENMRKISSNFHC
jgi:hypothetical protein